LLLTQFFFKKMLLTQVKRPMLKCVFIFLHFFKKIAFDTVQTANVKKIAFDAVQTANVKMHLFLKFVATFSKF
jgi:hypothetical protein